MYGNTEASTTRRPSSAVHAHRGRDRRPPSVRGAHRRTCTKGAGPSRRPEPPSRGSVRRSRPPGRVRARRLRTASNAGWLRIVAHEADRLHPLPPVLVGRQVVEPQAGCTRGSVSVIVTDASRVRVHRADVDLVPVVARRRRPVVAHGDRQEVEHQVRIRDVVVAPREPSALEVVRGARARAGTGAIARRPTAGSATCRYGRDRDRLRARVLDVDLQVVLEVLAHARHVLHDVDPERLQVVRVADARELERSAAS